MTKAEVTEAALPLNVMSAKKGVGPRKAVCVSEVVRACVHFNWFLMRVARDL